MGKLKGHGDERKERSLWVDSYKPVYESEIVASKNKVRLVKSWLKYSITEDLSQRKRLLFLTGPSGSCKSSTIDVLTKELGIEVIRWEDNFSYVNNVQDDSSLRAISFAQRYTEFMRTSCRSITLALDRSTDMEVSKVKGKIVIVENIPNLKVFEIRKTVTGEICQYLKSKRSVVPLIFVITDYSCIYDDENTENNSHKYYSEKFLLKDFYSSFNGKSDLITSINFLPVSITGVKKVLNLILTKENLSINKETLSLISENCAGDIRHAINTLQFYSKNGLTVTTKIPLKTIYSAAGNVLYRKFTSMPSSAQLNIDNIPERIDANSDLFALFLHENYINFFTDINDINVTSCYLGFADIICSSRNPLLLPYLSSIFSRSLVTCNQHPSPNKYRQLIYPELLKVKYHANALLPITSSLALNVGSIIPYTEYRNALKTKTLIEEIFPYCEKLTTTNYTLHHLSSSAKLFSPRSSQVSYDPELFTRTLKRSRNMGLPYYEKDDIEWDDEN